MVFHLLNCRIEKVFAASSDKQRDLFAGAVDTFDEDALDVGGL